MPEPLFSLPCPVRFTHTDPAGYVFFPRYFEMLQAVTEEWFTQALGVNYAELFLDGGVGWPTARTECDFVRPCRFGEVLDITVELERIGRSSLHLRYHGAVAGEARMRARSVIVAIELTHGRPVAIPEALRPKLEAYRALTPQPPPE